MSLLGPYRTLGEARVAAGSSAFELAFIDPVDGMIWLSVDTEPQDIDGIVDMVLSSFEVIEARRAE